MDLRRGQSNLISSHAVCQAAAGAGNIVADNVGPVRGTVSWSCRWEDRGAVPHRSGAEVIDGDDTVAESGAGQTLLGQAATRS